MIPGRKLVRKQTIPRSQAADPLKAETRFGTRNNSLPHIADQEVAEVSKTSQAKFLRTTSIDSISPTHSGTGSSPFPRSVSVSKLKGKVNNMGKTSGASKPRPSLRPDSASRFKKHKKGGLSLQLASDSFTALQRSFVVSRDSSGHAGQAGIARTFAAGVMKGDVSRLRSETPSMGGSGENESELDLREMEEAFLKALQGVPPIEVRSQLRIYHRFFSDVIRASGIMSSLLAHFKEGYESIIEELQEKYTREVSKLQTEIITLQNSILEEAEDRKTLLRKIEKLSRENLEMSETCESYEGKINDFQEKLFDIANVKMEDFPPTEEAWRLLNSELDYYKSWKKKISRELKITQSKEQKLIKLVHALKTRGYPVEEVYNTEVRTPAPTSHRTKRQQHEEDESLRLVTGRGKDMARPDNVPNLDFSSLEPYSASPRDSDSSSISLPHEAVTLRKALSDSSTHMMTEELERSEGSLNSQKPAKK